MLVVPGGDSSGAGEGEQVSKPSAKELLADLVCTDATCRDHYSINDLAARMEKVLERHKPMDYGDDVKLCFECHTVAPCPTVRILNGEE